MKLLQDLADAAHTMPLKISALTFKRPMKTLREIGLLTDNTMGISFGREDTGIRA